MQLRREGGQFTDRNVMCRHVYGTAAGLAAHAAAVACGTTAKGNSASHSFGSANARTTIVALSQQHAGMLAVGTRPDRDHATTAASAVVPAAAACEAAAQHGQYAKPPRAEAHYMTHPQLDYLEELFDAGEADKMQRTTAEAADEAMRGARGADGLLLYGPRKAAGALPGAERIKSWFSQEKRRKTQRKARFSANWRGRGKKKGCQCGCCDGGGGAGAGAGKERRCGRCGKAGHDRQTCVEDEGDDVE